MHNFNGQDRRLSPRIIKRVPLKVKVDSFDIVTETQNISSSGAYCQVDKYIAPMTKINIKVLLPVRHKNNRIVTKKMNCEGVVVRTEKSLTQEGKFNIAVFFNGLKKPDLHNYIESHINESLSPL